MPLRFIQVCAFLAYLLLLSSIPFKDILQFVYSFIHKEHLGCFQFQDVINKAIRAIYIQDFVCIYHFPRVNTEKWNCSYWLLKTNCGKSYSLIIFDYQVISNLLLEIYFIDFYPFLNMQKGRIAEVIG